ncbi:MAG: hypothetical protein E7294_09065 [Lachnospiraceae bacterium]|nr:hypothetical protein [Lachnospiraceae bacterium]
MSAVEQQVDIVLPWVDGADPVWRSLRTQYSKELGKNDSANTEIRYQSWDNLQYWFRAIETCMPWYHCIFLITCGHIPDFLNVDHPKLKIVKHEDYIPKKYLPTFNSNTIEMNLHRIKGLSENFVLFNDDLFPLRKIDETYYFKKNMPCDQAVESPIMPVDIGDLSHWSCMVKTNNLLIINKHFRKREVQKKNFFGWYNLKYGERLKRNIGLHYWNNFAGFHDPHMANAMKKSVLEKIWKAEPELLDMGSSNRFRGESDVSQYLIRYWQLCEGKFHPRKTLGKPFTVTVDNCRNIAEGIRRKEWQMVSLNEGETGEDFRMIKREINSALADLYPEKSSFEK